VVRLHRVFRSSLIAPLEGIADADHLWLTAANRRQTPDQRRRHLRRDDDAGSLCAHAQTRETPFTSVA
jgi:hypothetical protein